MIFRTMLRNLGASLCVVAAMSSVSYAATAPEVVINGVKGGRIISSDGAVQFAGATSDADGIKRINAQFKNSQNGLYLSPKGQFQKKAVRIPVKFNKAAAQTPWNTLRYKVPQGNYVFLLQVVDNREHRSQVYEVPVRVGAVAVAQSNDRGNGNKGAPVITIQFPRNGAVIKGPTVFSGLAEDNSSAVSRVVGSIRNADNGLFLRADGQFGGQRGELTMRSSGGRSAQWSSNKLRLPPGNYVFSVRGADSDNILSDWSQVNFTVAAANANTTKANTATTTATTAATTAAVATTARPATGNQPVATAATVSGGKAANGMNYCSNASKDIDGDGFGWENNGSCVVAGSRADTHPNCASSASDPDGDGFGWENERSCIVVVHCATTGSDPDGDGFGWENEKSCIVLQQTGRFPACASAASDPDGDGYGWEQNKTCLVAR